MSEPAPGRPRIARVSSHTTQSLHRGWSFCSVPAGVARDPTELAALNPAWLPAVVPGTVASSMRAAGNFDIDRCADFDAVDWWYRVAFANEVGARGDDAVDMLCFDGLATLADVWLNGTHVLASTDMFTTHALEVSSVLADENDLLIRFRSLRAALDVRRPRPRWRTKLVEHQQLRWQRTTLLGRMPGWSPPVRPVGPWRDVRLERRRRIDVVRGGVRARADDDGCHVDVAVNLKPLGSTVVLAATLRLGERRMTLPVPSTSPDGSLVVRASVPADDVERWWPHTHGAQPRYDAGLVLQTDSGDIDIAFGALGFRCIDVDDAGGAFTLRVNGAPVFCRGACWVTADIVSLAATEGSCRSVLALARDAGMNMLRVVGTAVYESDAFYDVCDELGILVWQDFMFANMDYPATDAGFVGVVEREVESNLARLRAHPSLAVLCGNSEVEQQAAMLGLGGEMWSNALFRDALPFWCNAAAPGVVYVPSSPSGGALPFHAGTGVSHYYGVGAYLRPLEDARRSNVRFTSECLGFSNVPDPAAVDALLSAGESAFHHPKWKSRVPRDHGAGWDFEDVRDHYLRELSGEDPMRLRQADMDRYLAMSRVISGEVMSRTLGEWRRGESTCRGALVWFLQDLWLGAGWGLLDAFGRPKAAYYGARRAMQPVAATITDEGVNGLFVHVVNDAPHDLDGSLRVVLYRGGMTVIASASTPLHIGARSSATTVVDELLGRFHDTAYAYRFGPPGHDVVAATVCDESGQIVADAFHFPLGLALPRWEAPLISARVTAEREGTVRIVLRAERFAQFVAIDAGEFLLDDNYFHVAPSSERVIFGRARAPRASFNGFAQALNSYEGIRLTTDPEMPIGP